MGGEGHGILGGPRCHTGIGVRGVSRALAHSGVDTKLLHLDHNNNVATALTKLTGTLSAAVLKVDNNGTGPALSLEVDTNRAPLTVNAAAGTATGLSADELDGKNSTQFANSSHAHAGEAITSGTVDEARIDSAVARDNEVMNTVKASDGAGSGLDADTIDGKDSSELVGTAGQSAQTSFGTGSLNVSPSSTPNTLIPGLEQTVQVPDGGVLFVSTDGGLQTQSTSTTGFSVVDVALSVDGVVSSQALFRRIVCANTGGFAQNMCTWNFGGTLHLSPGPHTLRVVASNGPGFSSAAQATVSGNNTTVLQGQLSVVLLNT